MTGYQEWFNKEYSNKEETKKIEFKRKNFQGQLVIESYPNLKELYLLNNKNMDKIILRNLEQLQECEIYKCGMQDLVIENCPRLEKLNVENNSLTNFIFLVNLESLEELKTNGNNQLTEILNPYHGDWKVCQKDLWEIFKLTTQNNFQGLIKKFWDLKKNREELKENILFLQKKFGHNTFPLEISHNTKELLLNLEKQFKDKEEKINYLEFRLNELIESSKQQKEKIINSLLQVFPEKDLLQELIKSNSEYTKAKKRKTSVIKLKKRKDEIYDELAAKLENNEEMMEKIESILTDCEELVGQELELENKLDNKTSLIKEQKYILSQVPDNRDRERRTRELEVKLVKTEEQKQSVQQITYIINNYGQLALEKNNIFTNQTISYHQQTLQAIEQEINQSLKSTTITPSEQKIINQTILYLGTQEIFLNYRQELVSNLIKGYCQLASKSKFTKLAQQTTQFMNISSKLAGAILGGAVAQAPLDSLGTIINLAQNTLQEKDLKKYLKKLQSIFAQDQQSLTLFDESYRSLINSIQFNNQSEIAKAIIDSLQLDHTQLIPFTNNQNIYKLGEIWEANLSNLSLEELKIFLENLDKKLLENQKEFQSQRQGLAQQEWFKIIDQKTDLLKDQEENQLENQVIQLDIKNN
ncbi:MAG: hypothetical protein mread185_000646 [Mycoplasmataceae bacterium]|nr:MAG: hypothetical protein mread185_000646 [Mycoplasmataceae bacterium]